MAADGLSAGGPIEASPLAGLRELIAEQQAAARDGAAGGTATNATAPPNATALLSVTGGIRACSILFQEGSGIRIILEVACLDAASEGFVERAAVQHLARLVRRVIPLPLFFFSISTDRWGR